LGFEGLQRGADSKTGKTGRHDHNATKQPRPNSKKKPHTHAPNAHSPRQDADVPGCSGGDVGVAVPVAAHPAAKLEQGVVERQARLADVGQGRVDAGVRI